MDRKYALVLVAASLSSHHLSSQGFSQLSINNVQATVFSNGLIGPTLPNGNGLLVPAGTGVSPLYTSGLWVGGTSPDNQLRFAAHLYGNSGERDFFPGPLTTDGTATITPATSAQYDHVWAIDRAAVELHRAYFMCVSDPGCDLAATFPTGYTVPEEFLTWPAMGDISAGQALYLAPFFDLPTKFSWEF